MQDSKEVRIKLTAAIDDHSLSNRAPGSLPVLNRASVSAQAVVFEGESLLVGGIIRDSLPDNLSPTPAVSGLSRSLAASVEQVEPIERMVLISPRLVATRAAPSALANPQATAVRPEPAQGLGATSRDQPAPRAQAVAAPEVVASARAARPSALAPTVLRLQDRRGPRDAYQRGESYEVEVTVAEPGFLYCYLIDVTQKIGQFFPNPQAPSAAVAAGSVLLFPGAFRFSLVAARQGGRETVVCLNSPKDFGSTPSLGAATDRPALQAQFERLAGVAAGKVQAAAIDIDAP